MDYQTWKETNENNNATTPEKFKKLQTEYGFHIVKENKACGKCLISGICNTPSCNNDYIKEFRRINNTGPYCNTCTGKRDLLINEFPDVANSIISEVDFTRLTSCSNKKLDFECSVHCPHCHKKHTWNAILSSRVRGGCPICSGRKCCNCIKKDVEFCCFTCKELKPLVKKGAGKSNLCILCRRKFYDGNATKFIKVLFSSTLNTMKNVPRKSGDISLEYLEDLYQIQEGKCYISGITMNAGSHHHWKMSIERLNNNIGYMNNNVVLICSEFQSAHRQITIERWDYLTLLVRGNMENLPDEDEFLTEYVNNSKIRKNNNKNVKKIQTNDDGQTKCNVCDIWLNADCYTKSWRTICRSCLSKKQKKRNGTINRRFSLLISNSKNSAKNRHGDAKEHSITIEDIYNQYIKQHARCAYTNIPLTMDGFFQASLERINVKKGYTKENICLIILGLNVGDHSVVKKDDDDREGFSGWNREKILFAVEQNPRYIVGQKVSVQEFLTNNPNV
jgi:hypothetical protein